MRRLANAQKKPASHVPVGVIKILDEQYCVLAENSSTARNVSQYPLPEEQAGGVVGQLELGGKRFCIVPAETNESSCATAGEPECVADKLTRRELQIVTLIAGGRANKQIADQLHISPWTVSTHLRRIFGKLGVDTRAAMIYKCSNMISNMAPHTLKELIK